MNVEEQVHPANTGGPLAMSSHLDVGRAYVSTAVLVAFAAIAAIAAAMVETQDPSSLSIFNNSDQFTQILSAGREGLILGALLPGLIGLAIYMVPLQVGINQIAFAKGVATSFWSWLAGLLLLVASYVMDGGPAGGRMDFVILWVLALAVMCGALIWALISVVATIIGARAQGMSLDRAPASTWGFFVFGLAAIAVLGLVMAELAIAFVRVRSGQLPIEQSSDLLAVAAPLMRPSSVFMICIPLLGMGVDIISVHSKTDVKSPGALMIPVGVAAFISVVGGFSYFATIQPAELSLYTTASMAAMALCVVAVLGYGAKSMVSGKGKLNPSVMAVLAAGKLFLAAVVVALVDSVAAEMDSLGIEPLTVRGVDQVLASPRLLSLEGTVVYGPIFALVIGAALLSLLAGLHHWSVKIWGRHLRAALTVASTLAVSIGSVLWAAAQILSTQLGGVTPTQLAGEDSELFFSLSLVGVLAVAFGSVLIIANVASLSTSKVAGSVQPKWTGKTLEWATANPPVNGNFPQAPVVKSASPLNDEVFPADDAPEISPAVQDVPALESGASL